MITYKEYAEAKKVISDMKKIIIEFEEQKKPLQRKRAEAKNKNHVAHTMFQLNQSRISIAKDRIAELEIQRKAKGVEFTDVYTQMIRGYRTEIKGYMIKNLIIVKEERC